MRSSHIYTTLFILSIISCTIQQETKKCPAFAAPVNGKIYGMCEDSKPGSVCSFSCNVGFLLEGTSNLTCSDNGQWSNIPPICQPDPKSSTLPQQNKENLTPKESQSTTKFHCPAIPSPLNGKVFGMCTENQPGSICVISCNPGFVAQGMVNLTCGENKKWSSAPPICLQQNQITEQKPITANIQCPSLIQPTNGILNGICAGSKPGNVCIFLCNAGFKVVGSEKLTCGDNGSWSSAIPSCQQSKDSKMCPDIYSPKNGLTSGVCANATNGAICKFECLQGFKINGFPSLLCNPDYTWSGKPPTCV